MATKAELRLSTYRLIGEDDPADATNSTPTNTHFASTEIDDYIQQAITLLGTEMEWMFQISEAPAVLDQALYELPSDFIAITSAFFDGTPIKILERGDLESINSNWQEALSDTPTTLYKFSTNTIGLYPAPDSDNVDKKIQVEYIRIPANLDSDSDVPELHTAFQMCLPFYAAYMAESKMGNDKKAAMNMQAYELHRKKLMARVQNWSPDLMRFKWSGDYE